MKPKLFDPDELEQRFLIRGGRIEWVTIRGFGMSFLPHADDNTISELRDDLKNVIWLSLKKTRVTDAALDILSSLSQIEDIDLSETRATRKGVYSLLVNVPSIRKICLNGISKDDDDSAQIKRHFPEVEFVEDTI